MPNDPRLQVLLGQLDNLLLMLERPVVQRQLGAFVLVAILAWFLSASLHWLVRRVTSRRLGRRANGVWQARLNRWLQAAEFTFFPLFAIVLSGVAIQRFQQNQWPDGLLALWLNLFWLVLGYRILVALLYATVGEQSAVRYHRRLLAPLFVVLVIVGLNRGLAGTFSAGSVELFTLANTPITLSALFSAGITLFIFLTVGWVLQDLLGRVILPRTNLDVGAVHTITTVQYYAIFAAGILSAATALGFNLSALAIVFGGLSVGIGFGLQDVVANFISGIVLMFEQTLRPGDLIEVNGQRGTVQSLRIRSTVVRSMENTELFVPNKNLLTSTLVTYTHTDRVLRRVINVGVSYGSDPGRVRDILLDVATRHGLVLQDPEPKVIFTAFGESSLDFQLLVWVNTENALLVPSDLHFMIWSALQKNQIEIPFPQRDLHVRNTVPMEMVSDRPTPMATNGNENGQEVTSSE